MKGTDNLVANLLSKKKYSKIIVYAWNAEEHKREIKFTFGNNRKNV